MYTELSDRALVDRILAGDSRASEAFCDRFFRFLCAVVGREWGRFPYMAKEIPQDVFVRLFRNDCRALRDWRGDEDIAPYLATIARRTASDYRKSRPTPAPVAPPGFDETVPEPVDPEPDPEELARIDERRRLIAARMQHLSPRDRDLIERRYLQDEEYEKIARELEMQVNAVYVAVHRAVARLGHLIRTDGFPSGEL